MNEVIEDKVLVMLLCATFFFLLNTMMTVHMRHTNFKIDTHPAHQGDKNTILVFYSYIM